MDKKKFRSKDVEDLRGFEEFLEGQPEDSNFLPRGVGGSNKKNEANFEHFTFLTNDSNRLSKVKNLLGKKLPFTAKFEQGQKLLENQKIDLEVMRNKLHDIFDTPNSTLRKSMSEIFDSYFGPPKI